MFYAHFITSDTHGFLNNGFFFLNVQPIYILHGFQIIVLTKLSPCLETFHWALWSLFDFLQISSMKMK